VNANVLLTPNPILLGQMGGQFVPEAMDKDCYDPKKGGCIVLELVRYVLLASMVKRRLSPRKNGSFI